MSTEPRSSASVPLVLIAGAGIGGLMLGTLLERIGIPYAILEHWSRDYISGSFFLFINLKGSAMSLKVNILPVFEQLGLYNEFMKISYPTPALNLFNQDMAKMGDVSYEGQQEIARYPSVIFKRPKLYELLYKQIPASKILLGKKILRATEANNKVTVHCSDNTQYEGDILVGADGAYSSVRQNLFKHLDEKGLLPRSDKEDFSVGYTCMVGVTEPQDPEKYPHLKDNFVHFQTVLGDRGLTAHKMLPGAGQGAINAMQDAFLLSSCLYDLPDTTPESITAAFKDYFDQRYEQAKQRIEQSRSTTKVMAGKTFTDKLVRTVMLNYMPKSLRSMSYAKMSAYRPQIAWLPLAKARGTGPVLHQKPSRRYAEEQEKAKASAAGATPV
ncbi:hypothetical protein KVV02_008774 [Mortierella alpina]|uniref:FAD-binding domain-containing protein n=1 Tax=Mortierella alpina TaxID=64518 RepID=A0A9P8A198_MORAP|nr:hypothetical protein KVV02_008774 [Mortierella alpina]